MTIDAENVEAQIVGLVADDLQKVLDDNGLVACAMSLSLCRKAADILNEALRLDPEGLDALVAHRVPTTKGIFDHRSIECHSEKGERPTLGVLGLLNGLVGTSYHDGTLSELTSPQARIVRIVDETGATLGFEARYQSFVEPVLHDQDDRVT